MTRDEIRRLEIAVEFAALSSGDLEALCFAAWQRRVGRARNDRAFMGPHERAKSLARVVAWGLANPDALRAARKAQKRRAYQRDKADPQRLERRRQQRRESMRRARSANSSKPELAELLGVSESEAVRSAVAAHLVTIRGVLKRVSERNARLEALGYEKPDVDAMGTLRPRTAREQRKARLDQLQAGIEEDGGTTDTSGKLVPVTSQRAEHFRPVCDGKKGTVLGPVFIDPLKRKCK